MRIRGKKGRELHVEPVRAPWRTVGAPERIVGVHRHVRVTLVGSEVGAWNGFSETLSAGDLRRLVDWLERAAGGDVEDVVVGRPGEELRLAHQGQGSVMVEVRGELRPWYWEHANEVVRFELETEPKELRRAAQDLRAEVEAWRR